MAISRRMRLLEAARKRLPSVGDMTPEEIQAVRRRRLPKLPVGDELLLALARWMFGTPRPSVAITTDTVEGAEGRLPARVHRPPTLHHTAPLVVHYHGGGWTIGSPQQYDWICSSVAEDVGAVVVSVDYRKAPEHPAPAAADDAVASYRWIAKNAEKFGASGRRAVMGDSAGGNLSALAAIAARDEGIDLAAQVLIYPSVDLTRSFPSVHQLRNEPILTFDDIDAFLGHYLQGGIDPGDPRISPWFVDDLSGVAPALVQTAAHDPLVDEGDAYAAKLVDAGVEVRHTRYVDVPHGFASLPGIEPVARQAVAEIATFLREKLTGVGPYA